VREAPIRRADSALTGRARAAHEPFIWDITTLAALGAMLALALLPILGTLCAAAFLGAVILLVVLKPLQSLDDIRRFAPLLSIALLALISTIWSDAPERTLRAGIQLFFTIVAAIVIARRVSAERVILMLFAGFTINLLVALPYVPGALLRGYALVGLMGSKNAMAFSAHMLMALSLAIMVDHRQNRLARLAACAAIPASIAIIFLCHSAGATASAIITLVAFPAFLLLGRLHISFRLGVMLTLLLLLIVAFIFLADLQYAWADFRLTVLKKDATLTGRTYLWDFAFRLIAERPALGHGYYAFWRQGNIDAEGLWRWAMIASRTGFNFHNAFVEMLVDLGWVGFSVFLITCVSVAGMGLYRQITRPSIPMAFFLSMLAILFARSYSETGLIAPFSQMTFLLLATGIYAVAPSKKTGRPGISEPREAAIVPRRV